jgi:hypothetical protein
MTVPWSQFVRTVSDVQAFLDTQHQIPSTIWFGSVRTTPERYLAALANVAAGLLHSSDLAPGERRGSVRIPTATLATTRYVAADKPSLWNWVIFPEGFHAPNLMALARLQAWTLKPAVLHGD